MEGWAAPAAAPWVHCCILTEATSRLPGAAPSREWAQQGDMCWVVPSSPRIPPSTSSGSGLPRAWLSPLWNGPWGKAFPAPIPRPHALYQVTRRRLSPPPTPSHLSFKVLPTRTRLRSEPHLGVCFSENMNEHSEEAEVPTHGPSA